MTKPRFALRPSQVSRLFHLCLVLALAGAFLRGQSSQIAAAAPLRAVPADAVTVPAGGTAYLQVRGLAMEPGGSPQGSYTLATPSLATERLRTTLFYGIDWGYADSEPQQVALALWWAQTGTWSDPNHSTAQRIATAAANAPGLPSWNPDGRSLIQLATEGQLSIAPLSLTAPASAPSEGEGTLSITNSAEQDAVVYLPYGTLFMASSGQIIVWSVGVSQAPPQATVPAGTQPTSTATAIVAGTAEAATNTAQPTAISDSSATPAYEPPPIKRRQSTPTPSSPPPPKDSPTAEATDTPAATPDTATSTNTAQPAVTSTVAALQPTATSSTDAGPPQGANGNPAQPPGGAATDSSQRDEIPPVKRGGTSQGKTKEEGQAVAQGGLQGGEAQNKDIQSPLGGSSASIPLLTPAVRATANGDISVSVARNGAPLPVGTQAPNIASPQPPAAQQTAQGTIPRPNSTAPAPVPTGPSKTSIPSITSVPTQTTGGKATSSPLIETATVKVGGIAGTATATKVPAPTPAPVRPTPQATKGVPPVIVVGPDIGKGQPTPPGAPFPTANTGKGPAPSTAPITGAGPSSMPLWLSLSSALMMLAGWGLRRVASAKALARQVGQEPG